MNAVAIKPAFYLAIFFVGAIAQVECHGHNERVHMEISASAFRSSDGIATFLGQTVGVDRAPYIDGPSLGAKPPPFESYISSSATPYGWVLEGSYYGDMMDAVALRSSDHFYTVQPQRVAGEVNGLTDSSETLFLYSGIVNSFAWASTKGINGPTAHPFPISAGPNIETWPDARDHQYAALTSATKASRDENLALMLYTLGHILHLNQDLSQPEHTRNDAHPNNRHIENYGFETYLQNAWRSAENRASLFPLRPRGWDYWRANGFIKLVDFWDRNLYKGNAKALDDDAIAVPGAKLGLAEFSNGNFLGEDAIYAEYFKPGDKHHFPFPSRNTSTQYSPSWQIAVSPVENSFLKDGSPIRRVHLKKVADGFKLSRHSVLGYLDVIRMTSPESIRAERTLYTPSINDPTVLDEYHSILIPKAIEYSAGILDYFFRGRLEKVVWWDTSAQKYRILITNKSGQDFKGGTFTLYRDDAAGNRSPVPLTLNWSGTSTLANDASIEASFSAPPAGSTKHILVYKGAIGTDGVNPVDSVDADMAIATTAFDANPQNTTPGSVFIADNTSQGNRQLLLTGSGQFSVAWTGLDIGFYQFEYVGGAYSVGSCFWVVTDTGGSGQANSVAYQYHDGVEQTPSGGNKIDFPLSTFDCYTTLAAAEADYAAKSLNGFWVREPGGSATIFVTGTTDTAPTFRLVRTLKLKTTQPTGLSIDNLATYADGRWITSYGGSDTPGLAFNASASSVQSTLNALASITTDDGVTVTGDSTSGFTVNWNTPGPRSLLSARVTTVSPFVVTGVERIQAGALPGTKEIQKITVGPYCLDFEFNGASPEWSGQVPQRDLRVPQWHVTATPDENNPTLRLNNVSFLNARVKFITGPDAPITAPSASAGSGGNVDAGGHQWRVSFLQFGSESGGGPVSSPALNLTSASRVNLTGIPIGPSGTTARVIYRTLAGGDVFYQVGTINDNPATTFEDNVSDAEAYNNGFGIPVRPASNFWLLLLDVVADWDGIIKFDAVGWSGLRISGDTPQDGPYYLSYPYGEPQWCPVLDQAYRGLQSIMLSAIP